MEKKPASAIMLALLLTSILTLAFNIQPVRAEPKTWIVDDDGPADFHTIQEAINSADEGDTIFVRSGTYYEHVVVNKTVSLLGENRETTIVDGNGSGDVIVCRSVTDITISNFTIQNGQRGLDLTYSYDCLIADNRIIHHSVCGITGGGMHFMDNSILRNTISYCQFDGIRLGTGAQRILVKGNVIANVSLWWALVIDDSWEIIVEENDISNTLGIRFYRSDGNIVRRNTISKSGGAHAIVLFSSNDNVVEGNMLTDNGGGLYVYGVNNTVCQNDIVGNNYGISIGKPDNTIYHNNFINNYYQVWLIDGLYVENQWDNGYPSGGNYWTDYTGVDANGDGIGDTPYVIDEYNRDRYPLMEPRKTVSGNLEILEPANGSTIAGPVAITFTIENTGDYIEFLQGDSSNRIDLEIEYRSTGGEIYAWGIMFWSTSYCGLTLRSGEEYEQTLVYDPSEYEGSVPPDFVGDAPYGQTTIRLVHWKRMDEGYGYGEFGVTEINVTLLPPDTEPPTVSILSPQNTTYTTTSIPLTFTVNESTYWIGYSLDNQANVTITGNTTLTNLVNGTHSIIVYANDTSGNMGASNMVFFTIQVPPPLSASISPLSASILVGQSVTFTSTVSEGYTPYSYQWYLNGNPVSGATSASWTFTPTTSGIYYIYLKVTDAKGNTAQSETARITAATVPVGGYSFPIHVETKTEPVLPYIALIAALTAVFTKLRPKTKRKR